MKLRAVQAEGQVSMAKVFYPAVLEKSDALYGVTFPDLPGLISSGATADEALINAHEALAGHVAAMVKNGDPLPPPSKIGDVIPDPEIELVAISLVSAPLPASPAA